MTRSALADVQSLLEERSKRWRQIEKICGFDIINNPGFQHLDALLHSSTYICMRLHLTSLACAEKTSWPVMLLCLAMSTWRLVCLNCVHLCLVGMGSYLPGTNLEESLDELAPRGLAGKKFYVFRLI